MSELNINSLADFVSQADILWAKGFMSVPQIARGSGLFKEVAIPNMTGNTRTFSEIDLEEYATTKGEDDQATRARVQQGYSKTGTLYRIAKDVNISYEMRNYGKYEQITNKLTNLGKLAPNRLDIDLTHRLTFGTATSYTNMDGDTVDISIGDTLALFSTVHTLRGSSTTFRNILANNPQFSPGSLEAMETMRKQNTYNQFGQKMTISADILWSADDPSTNRAISESLRSSSNPTQNNPGVINTQTGKYKHVILPRLDTTAAGANDSTKSKRWGIASSELSTAYLGMNEEAHLKAPPVSGSNAEEFSTDSWSFGVRAGYMIVVVSASWISMSAGDGTA